MPRTGRLSQSRSPAKPVDTSDLLFGVEPGFFRTELLTSESTNYAEPSIDDYAGRTEQTVAVWNSMNGQQGGDPAKLANALVQLAGQEEPPLRWVAGADLRLSSDVRSELAVRTLLLGSQTL